MGKKIKHQAVENWTLMTVPPVSRREYQVFTSAGKQKVAEFVPDAYGQGAFWLHDLGLDEDFEVVCYRDLPPDPTKEEINP